MPWAVRIGIQKKAVFLSTAFQPTQNGNACGLLPLVVRIGRRVSILGYAVNTSYRGVRAMIQHLLIMFLLYIFDHVKSPQKRRLITNMSRYERTVCTKKRRVANDDRAFAAQSLLGLSESGNGSHHTQVLLQQ